MKKLSLVILILALVYGLSIAQNSKGNINLGAQLSLLNSVSVSGSGSGNADGGLGFVGKAEYMFIDNIGIEANINYIPVGTDWNTLAFFIGGSYHQPELIKGFDTFGEILLGMATHTGDIGKEYDGGFSWAAGGGVSYKFMDKLSGLVGYRYIAFPASWDYNIFGVTGSYSWTLVSSQIYVGINYQL